MSVNKQLVLTEDYYNADLHLSTHLMSNQKVLDTNVLSSVIVQLYGGINNALPLLLMTEGDPMNKGMMQTKTIGGNNEYQVDIFGKVKTNDTIARTTYADNAEVGKAGAPIKLIFSTNWLLPKYTIQEGRTSAQVRIIGSPIQVSGGYEYTCQLIENNPEAYLPPAAFQKNARWAALGYVAALEGSTGTGSHRRLPSRMTNQYSYIRKSFNIRGNAANKVMNIQIPMDGGKTTNIWSNFEVHERRREFLKEMDDLLVWSRYNRVNGEILEKDEKGEPIPRFSGLLEQIPNVDTYSFLTEAKIDWIVTNILHNIGGYGEAVVKEITLQTGLGGAKEFDRAMKASGATQGFTQFIDRTLVGGTTANATNLTYGTYFGSYKHIKDYTVKVVINDAFDRGPVPDAAPRHPVTGLSLESYKMLFLDTSVYNGEKNLQFINEKGREYIEKVILGFTPTGIMGYDSSYIATDRDESSVQFGKTLGIHILRPTNCFVLNYEL
jgi:hypothetical protein